MDETFGGNGFNTTQTDRDDDKSKGKAEGLAPVFIRQIIETPEGNFQMWGMTFNMVTCVFIVRGIETSSTKITYQFEDHTGQIDGHYWIEEGAKWQQNLMINNYARVYGSIRQHIGKKTLMIYKIAPVTSVNELNTHMLEVLTARYRSEEFSTTTKAIGGVSDFPMANDEDVPVNERSGYGLEGKQLAVFQAIKAYVSDVGISLQKLQKTFPHISQQELIAITDFLSQEGHIFTSFDSEHFLCTG